jgi:hypothetical protein
MSASDRIQAVSSIVSLLLSAATLWIVYSVREGIFTYTDARASMINAVIDMKAWALSDSSTINLLKREPTIVKAISVDSAALNMEDFFSKCRLMFQLERIFAASQPMKDSDKHGARAEVALWLRLPGMQRFFEKFALKYQPHSLEFKEFATKTYAESKENVPQ